MRDALGGTVVLVIIVVFIVIVSGYMAFNVNYTKAFRIKNKIVDNYNYDWTELDCMPNGWRRAFGKQFMEELRKECIKYIYE